MHEIPDWSYLDEKATALDLSHHPNVRSDSLPALIDTLLTQHGGPYLTTLDLSNNHLGTHKGMRQVARLLTHHGSLTTIRLARNGFKGSKRAMRHLMAAAADNSVLRVLDISHNQLKDKCVVAATDGVAKLLDSRQVACRLTELDCSNNGSALTAKSAWALGSALVQGHNTTLKILRLSGNALQPPGGDALGTLLKLSHSLQELYVANCNLRDEGVQYLCQGLLLAENEPALRVLDVAWNVLHDEAALAVAQVLEQNAATQLQRIQLECNGIGDKGAAALAAALPLNESLQILDVRGNQIHDCGAIALAKALCDTRCNASLELCWEMNAHMTAVGRHRLEGALQLRASRREWLNDLLQTLQGLRQFPAVVCTAGDDEVVEICKHVATQQRKHAISLPVVRFKGPGITLRGVKAVANQLLCPPSVTLTHLYLVHTSMGNDGANLLAQALLRNTSLTTLTCMNCEWTDDGAVYLSRALPRHNGRLGRLDLRQNRIGTEGARALLHAVTQDTPSLHTLYLNKNLIGDGAVRSLSAVGHLVTLNLADNLLTDATALDLARICGNIAAPTMTPASAAVGVHEIKWLDVSRNYLTQRGIKALDMFLPDLCTLDASDQHDPSKALHRQTLGLEQR